MSDTGTDGDEDRDHALKKAKIKAAKDALYASKTGEKGLIVVHTGTGKGKSTAAWGMVLRALGHGYRVGIVQFVKGAREIGERVIFDRFPDQLRFVAHGEGFTWETQDRQKDMALADATREAAAGSTVDVRQVACLGNCKRGLSAAVLRAGSWSYIFGELDTDSAADLVTGAELFAGSTDGFMPFRNRPEALKRGLIARVPTAANLQDLK